MSYTIFTPEQERALRLDHIVQHEQAHSACLLRIEAAEAINDANTAAEERFNAEKFLIMRDALVKGLDSIADSPDVPD